MKGIFEEKLGAWFVGFATDGAAPVTGLLRVAITPLNHKIYHKLVNLLWL